MRNFRKLRNHASIIALFFLLAAAFLIFTSLKPGKETAKDGKTTSTAQEPLEIRDDPYVYIPREGRVTSPAYRFSSTDFFATQVNVIDTNLNIVGDAANEPSIAVDPTDPNRMAIGWRQFDTVNNNFRQAGYAFTNDGGQVWTFPGVIEPGVFRSDPVLDSDSSGIFYYNSLTVVGPNSDYQCDVFKSTDGGATWDMGTFAQGGDKQWMVIDKTGGISDGHIYSYWTQFFSICFPGFFTRSVNQGASYENCVQIPDSPQWGTLAVGPNGELYVGGIDNDFVVARSSNAQDSSQIVSWDFSSSVSLDGDIGYGGGPNPGGLSGQTWIAVDRSNGPYQGNVYLLCSVEPYSGPDPLNVMFSRSTDGGVSWSTPVRVNDDPGTSAWQWFGTMSVAPDGRIDVVWLDTRDNPGTYLSSLYYAYSVDGGATWSQNERLSMAFDPHIGWPQQDKMGDYFDMVSDENGANLAWAGTFNGEQDVYYGRITLLLTSINDQSNKSEAADRYTLFQNFPNPFNPETAIEFSIPNSEFVTLKIYNILGEEVTTLVSERLTAGRHKYEWDASRLTSGIYLYRLESGSFRQTKKLILLK